MHASKKAKFCINISVNSYDQAELTCTGWYWSDQRGSYQFKDPSYEILNGIFEEDNHAVQLLKEIWAHHLDSSGLNNQKVLISTNVSQVGDSFNKLLLKYMQEDPDEGRRYSVVVRKTNDVDDSEDYPTKMPIVVNFFVEDPIRPQPEIINLR